MANENAVEIRCLFDADPEVLAELNLKPWKDCDCERCNPKAGAPFMCAHCSAVFGPADIFCPTCGGTEVKV